jgi:hypothetical protein
MQHTVQAQHVGLDGYCRLRVVKECLLFALRMSGTVVVIDAGQDMRRAGDHRDALRHGLPRHR